MKQFLLTAAILGAVAVPAIAHADTTYIVTNGILSSPYLGTTPVGTYSGTFTLGSNFTITSGSFTATVNSTTYSVLSFTPPPYNGAGYAVFFDNAGDHLNLQLINTQGNNVILCTVALCGSGDTLFQTAAPNNGMYNFSANGGTLTPVTPSSTVTPEPSSFALFGTGIVAAAGAMRRRVQLR